MKNYLSKFFDRSILDAITWSQGIPFGVPGGNDNAGFTLDDPIYFGRNAYDPTDGISPDEISLIGHEVTHSRQYRQNGSLRQKRNYLLEGAKKGILGVILEAKTGISGVAYDVAYYGNKFEREALEMEEKIKKDLAKNGNPCP